MQVTKVSRHCFRAPKTPGSNLPHMSSQPSRENGPAIQRPKRQLLQCSVCDNSLRHPSRSGAAHKHCLWCHCSRGCCYTSPYLKTKTNKWHLSSCVLREAGWVNHTDACKVQHWHGCLWELRGCQTFQQRLVVMVQAFNPSTWEAEIGGSLWVQGQFGLQELVPGQAPKLKKKKKKQKKQKRKKKTTTEKTNVPDGNSFGDNGGIARVRH